MPKKTRKYPSQKKTTSLEGYREYKKLEMRERRSIRRQQRSFILSNSRLMKRLKSEFPVVHDYVLGSKKRLGLPKPTPLRSPKLSPLFEKERKKPKRRR